MTSRSITLILLFHAFFTTVPTDVMDTVAADRTHRGHASIEQAFADLKGAALAVIAFNLTRAVGTIAGGLHARAATATIRRRIINITARIATFARRITLHLPTAWP